MPLIRAQEPFIFKTQLSLVETTGLKAADLAELNSHLKQAPESCVYYHTHHFLRQHQFLTPEPPNDFAYWVTEVLQESLVGEQLAAIDTVRFGSLSSLKEAIVDCIDRHLEKKPLLRKAPEGEEFYFLKSILFNLPTAHQAYDLVQFLECLKKVSADSLYNHVFGARLRPPRGVNDFSYWLSTSLGEKKLASKIEKLDPYTHTMEGLRKTILRLLEQRLEEISHD
jgi:hypothetical protein